VNREDEAGKTDQSEPKESEGGKMKKRFMLVGLVAVLLVVVLTAVACGGAKEDTTTTAALTDTTAVTVPATGKPIKVGMVTSLTGPSAAPGQSIRNGANYQVKYINDTGGINGRPIELLIEDDKSEVTSMTAAMTKLIEEDGIEYFVGPFIQFGQEAARQICEDAQIPMVGAGPESLAQIAAPTEYKWSVMMSAGPVTQADGLAKMIKAHGYKKIVGIADTLSIHTETLIKLAEMSATEGFSITVLPDTFGLVLPDPQAIVNKIKQAYDSVQPDAILTLSNPLAQPAIYQGLRGVGITVPIHGSPAAAHPSIMAKGAAAVEGLYVMDSGGLLNPQPLPDSWPTKPFLVDFYERYVAHYTYAPDFFAAVGADYFIVLQEAMKKAGGADDKAAVAQALQSLTDVTTLEGLQTYTPADTMEGVHGFLVEYQIKNGKFEFIRTLN
jgi:branched-chain amino acid transport system substrate-binding protein